MTTAEMKILQTETAAMERIASWWREADVLPHYPMSTETAIELLRGQEYDANADIIHKFIDDRRVPNPARKAGKIVWNALDLMLLAGVFEFNRRWLPFSKLHDWKKSQFARSIEQAEAAGRNPKSVFEDLANYSVTDLLLMLVRNDDQGAREICYEAVRLKLELKHGDD